mmetsp:Transcript_9467/g.27360  ORF Transcript_9467/g.27360 Transcript_9467/m.27360 type:complete len:228 (-) Transcript_9467:4953-5636(-)
MAMLPPMSKSKPKSNFSCTAGHVSNDWPGLATEGMMKRTSAGKSARVASLTNSSKWTTSMPFCGSTCKCVHNDSNSTSQSFAAPSKPTRVASVWNSCASSLPLPWMSRARKSCPTRSRRCAAAAPASFICSRAKSSSLPTSGRIGVRCFSSPSASPCCLRRHKMSATRHAHKLATATETPMTMLTCAMSLPTGGPPNEESDGTGSHITEKAPMHEGDRQLTKPPPST